MSAVNREPRTYTIPDVALILNVSSWTVRRLIKAGTLRALRVGDKWRVTPEHLEAYLRGEKKK